MLDLLRQAVEALVTMADGVITLVKWLPGVLTFYATSSAFIPVALIPIAGVTVVIYLAKLLLGGDNS